MHPEVQKILIGKDALKLKDATDTVHEATKKQMTTLSPPASSKIDAVSKQPWQKSQQTCRKCGLVHSFDDRQKCPTFGKECRACGKLNHWEQICRPGKLDGKTRFQKSDRKKTNKFNCKDIHAQQEEDYTSEEEFLSVGMIKVHEMESKNSDEDDEAYSAIQVQKKVGKKRTFIDLRVKVDTGAE